MSQRIDESIELLVTAGNPVETILELPPDVKGIQIVVDRTTFQDSTISTDNMAWIRLFNADSGDHLGGVMFRGGRAISLSRPTRKMLWTTAKFSGFSSVNKVKVVVIPEMTFYCKAYIDVFFGGGD